MEKIKKMGNLLSRKKGKKKQRERSKPEEYRFESINTDSGEDKAKTSLEAASSHKQLFVAAIDFGTTFSGYAYCARQDKSKIYMPIWEAPGHCTYIAPTCVLLKLDRSFHTFGYDAEENFHIKQDKDDFRSWYFFKNFKMLLYTKKDILDSETEVEDEMASTCKTKMKAVDVFAVVINYFRNECLKKIQIAHANLIVDSDIHWVLTVPGIWNIKAKQFMRDAALKAGIANDQLSLALEPEAASLYCRNLSMFIEESKDKGKTISQLKIGEKYIVLDQGGGTIDLAIHEVASESTLKEIHQACGGGWGSNTINETFQSFVLEIFGNDVIDKVKKEEPVDYYDFLNTIEKKKITFTPERKGVTFRVPLCFIQCYKSINNDSFHNGNWKNKYTDNVSFCKDKMTIKNTLFMSWINKTVLNIVSFMQDIFAKEHLRDIDKIFAVGGFSKSNILMEKLKEEFSRVTVITPEDSDIAVLKGAILYAFDPRCISCRVAQCTYGISMQMPHDPIKYPGKENVVGMNKRLMVDDVFDKHVEVGQIVNQDDIPEEHEYFPTIKDHTSITLEVFASSKRNPIYTDDEFCTFLGVLQFDLKTRSRVFVRMHASGTELVAIAREEKTNNEFKGYFSLI